MPVGREEVQKPLLGKKTFPQKPLGKTHLDTKSLAAIGDRWVKVKCGLRLVEQWDIPRGYINWRRLQSLPASFSVRYQALKKDEKNPKKSLLWSRHGEEEEQP